MFKHELAWTGNDRWHLKIWMCETYASILEECFPEITFNFALGEKGTCTAPLRIDRDQEQKMRDLLDIFKNHVLLKKNEHIAPYFEDELDHCFALNYNLEELPGTSITEYTQYGALEHKAKENRDAEARAELVEAFTNLCKTHPVYRRAEIVMPIPPNPSKTFHLPVELAKELAEKTGKRDGTALIKKIKETRRLQGLSLEEKSKELKGAIEITGDVEGRSIILIDDLYQSGFTMWTVAKLLKKKVAKRVLGLACVKSWRDTDNQ
jgi:predicted amidophosphoribosyltransferase